MTVNHNLVVANILSDEDDRLRSAIEDPENDLTLDIETREKLRAIAEVRDQLIGQTALGAVDVNESI